MVSLSAQRLRLLRRALWLTLVVTTCGFALLRAAWPSFPALTKNVPIEDLRLVRLGPPSFLGTTRPLISTLTPVTLLGPNERYCLSFDFQTEKVKPGALLTASLLYPTESPRPSQEAFTPLSSNQRGTVRTLFDTTRNNVFHFPALRVSAEATTAVRVGNVEIRRLTSLGHSLENACAVGALASILGLLVCAWIARRRTAEVLTVGTVVFAVLTLLAPHGRNGDPYWNTPTGLSWLMTGDITVDEFLWETDLPTVQVSSYPHRGHWYNYFPIGMTVLALPFDAAGLWLYHRDLNAIDGFAAQGLFAILAATFYGLSRTLGYSAVTALTLTFLLGAATPNVWLGTGGTNSHTGAQLMVVVALWLLASARPGRAPNRRASSARPGREVRTTNTRVALAALPLALAVITRPTTIVVVVCCTAYVLACHRRTLGAFVGLGLVAAAVFCAFNWTVYQSPLPPYFRASRLSLATWWAGLAAQTLSPNRGALFFTPIYCFSLIAAWRAVRSGSPFDKLLAITPIPFGMLIAAFPIYTGGWGFGSRFYLDVAPLLVLLLGPTVESLDVRERPVRTAIFSALAIFSVWIHSRIFDWHVVAWNTDPVDVTYHQERVWDIRDPAFLRGL